MERKVINHFCHEHPLILIENVNDAQKSVDCYGCGNAIADLELAYVCLEKDCSNKIILHRTCGELPTKICHPKHPLHPLHLYDCHKETGRYCDVCYCDLDKALSYQCRSCDFDIDLRCKKVGIDALLEEERKHLQHPGHHHPLTLMRKPAATFYCDGCGEEDVDMAYICSSCEFWVHKSCALLPFTFQYPHHHHQLSLAFNILPVKHSRCHYRCEVCDKRLDRTCWVYFCGDCRYFVHLKCVGSTIRPNIKDDDNDGSDLMVQFPLNAHDMSNELITHFVIREQGLDCIPDAKDETSNLWFSVYHEHPLSLVLESRLVEEEAKDDEMNICEACVTPISSPPYYECASCRYFIHFICRFLPITLSASYSPHTLKVCGDCEKIPNKNHKFSLFVSSDSKHKDIIGDECELCGCDSNGMGYICDDCEMIIDVKCAALPNAIKHEFHSHKSLLLARIPPYEEGVHGRKYCRSCLISIDEGHVTYYCSNEDCDFALHLMCSQLPMRIINEGWDKHPLWLTCEASLDHPSDFICDFCEDEIHPKAWMYNCRQCDVCFHIFCFRAASGWYRNIKFGRGFKMDRFHPHPLTFNWITLKRCCDFCSQPVYLCLGFECVSCFCVVCFECGCRELGIM